MIDTKNFFVCLNQSSGKSNEFNNVIKLLIWPDNFMIPLKIEYLIILHE